MGKQVHVENLSAFTQLQQNYHQRRMPRKRKNNNKNKMKQKTENREAARFQYETWMHIYKWYVFVCVCKNG